MIFLSLHYGVPAQAQRSGLCGEKEGQRNGADARRQVGVAEWSLFRRADAEGGLKGPARPRRSLRGLGGVSHQQASAGIYRRIACRYFIYANICTYFKCFLLGIFAPSSLCIQNKI